MAAGLVVLALLAAVGGWFLLGTLGGEWSPIDRLFLFPAEGAAFRSDRPWATRQPVRDLSLAAIEAVCGVDPRPQRAVNVALHLAAAAILFLILVGDVGPAGPDGKRAVLIPFLAAAAWLVNPSAWPLLLALEGRGPLLEAFLVLAAFWTARGAARGSVFAGLGVGLAAVLATGSGPLGWFAFILAGFGLASAEDRSGATLSIRDVWEYDGGRIACVGLALTLGLSAAWLWRAPPAAGPAPGWEAVDPGWSARASAAQQDLVPACVGAFGVVDVRPTAAEPVGSAWTICLGGAAVAFMALFVYPVKAWPWCVVFGMLFQRALVLQWAPWGGLELLLPSLVGWLACIRFARLPMPPKAETPADPNASPSVPAAPSRFAPLLRWAAWGPAVGGIVAMGFQAPDGLEWLRRLGHPPAFWERMIQIRPKSAADWARNADAQLDGGWIGHAVLALETSLELKPNFGPALAWRGEADLAYRRWDQAKHWFELAGRESPDAVEVLCGWCDYYYKSFQPAELGRAQAAADAAYPNSLEVRWRRARTYVVLDRAAQAEEIALAVLRDDPTDPEPRFTLAEIELGRGQAEKATRILAEVLARDPRSPRGNYLTGVSWTAPGPGRPDWWKAYEFDSAAVGADPFYFDARFHAALALVNLGQADQAAALAAEAAPLTPNPAKVLFFEAKIRRGQGRSQEAVELLEKCIAAEPEWFEPIFTLGWLRAVNPDPKIRRPAEAVQLARRLIAQPKQRDARAWDLLAAGLAGERRFEEAVAAATEAIDLAVAAGKDDFALDVRQRRDLLYAVGQPYLEAVAPQKAP